MLDSCHIEFSPNLLRDVRYAFFDPSHGDLYLAASGKKVVDEGIPLWRVQGDTDPQPRGTVSTLGADEKELG